MGIKHKYSVYGVSCVGGSLFTGTCVADDIIKAIELFRERQCSVWNIERKEQVSADATIEITSLNILGGYSAEGKSRVNIYGLYKRIMKRDPKAVDDINTLDEAKEIIKMITGNVYLNGEMYNLQQEYMAFRMAKEGSKDCLSCYNSCSEPCDDGDILHCMELDGEIVEDNGYCDKWN